MTTYTVRQTAVTRTGPSTALTTRMSPRSECLGEFGEQLLARLGFGEHELDS